MLTPIATVSGPVGPENPRGREKRSSSLGQTGEGAKNRVTFHESVKGGATIGERSASVDEIDLLIEDWQCERDERQRLKKALKLERQRTEEEKFKLLIQALGCAYCDPYSEKGVFIACRKWAAFLLQDSQDYRVSALAAYYNLTAEAMKRGETLPGAEEVWKVFVEENGYEMQDEQSLYTEFYLLVVAFQMANGDRDTKREMSNLGCAWIYRLLDSSNDPEMQLLGCHYGSKLKG